jgi:hypothetical protein
MAIGALSAALVGVVTRPGAGREQRRADIRPGCGRPGSERARPVRPRADPARLLAAPCRVRGRRSAGRAHARDRREAPGDAEVPGVDRGSADARAACVHTGRPCLMALWALSGVTCPSARDWRLASSGRAPGCGAAWSSSSCAAAAAWRLSWPGRRRRVLPCCTAVPPCLSGSGSPSPRSGRVFRAARLRQRHRGGRVRPVFPGAFRTLSGLVAPTERAGTIAVIYIVSYLAFSIPIVAGRRHGELRRAQRCPRLLRVRRRPRRHRHSRGAVCGEGRRAP